MTQTLPRAGSRSVSGAAPLRADGARLLQVILFGAGAALLPLGVVVIAVGWYGAAHTPYEYDQLTYIVSALFGLGLTFCGGFLYFGAWLARIATDQKENDKRLADTLLLLADSVAHNTAGSRPAGAGRDAGSVLVMTPGGTTVHRADCSLVANREDIEPAGVLASQLSPCRVCRAEVPA
ncbi:MAG: hypothetical protein JWR35_1950 [Marmoricola sp.]|nr:hypothetical protein [Marmoricola sp.]